MSENPSSPPPSDRAQIKQSINGDFSGPQQAINGNGNNQTVNDYRSYIFNVASPYPDLCDSDFPKPLVFPAHIFNYAGVILFLITTLVSWIIFGGFSKFPFPYWEIIDLISCCFKGNIASKVTSSQLEFQLENISSKSLKDLNRSEIRASVYLGILERLGSTGIESDERIAKTIEVLKYRRKQLGKKIEPIQINQYKRVKSKLERINFSVIEKDLKEIESIIDDVNHLVIKSQLSDHVIEDTIDWISKRILRESGKISPSRLGIIYRIQTLIREISSKQISKLSESELSSYQRIIIDKLQKEADVLKKKLLSLNDTYSESQSIVKELSSQVSQLGLVVNRDASKIVSLESQIKDKHRVMQSQIKQIEYLDRNLNDVKRQLLNFEQQQVSNRNKYDTFKNTIISKDSEIEELRREVDGLGKYKILNGYYLGIPAKKGSSYHFYPKCRDWKMLVGEYVLNLDSSREVISDTNPQYFIRCGLKEYENCRESK